MAGVASVTGDEHPLRRSSSYDILPPNIAGDEHPLRRSGSYDILPPNISELRVVLLGNSWSDRSSVGNLILGVTAFNTEDEPDICQRVTMQLRDKHLVLINTPDLLHPNISDHELSEHVKNCVRLADPGPHVFLLVLQPEGFTKELRVRLCRVLLKFSDRSFDHSLLLLSDPRHKSSGSKKEPKIKPPLKYMIKECKYRYMKMKDLERYELLTRLGQIVKERSGEHVRCDGFEDTTSTLQTSFLGAVQAAGKDTFKEKETIDRQLELSREEMKKKREEWEKERQEEWEKRHQENEQRQQEEETKIRNLQEKYEEQRKHDENKKREEDRLRREQEEKDRNQLVESYKQNIERLRKKTEDEEFNEFKMTCTNDFEALEKQYMETIEGIKKRHERENDELKKKHEQEILAEKQKWGCVIQ